MLRWEPNRCSLLCGLATLLVASGCGVATSTGDDAKEVNLFVAASTASVVEPLMSDFQRVSPAVVRCNAAASSTLAHQIEHGAPADIFLSANQSWMDYLAKKDLIEPESRVDFLSNRLVLVAPAKAIPSAFTEKQ